MFTPSDTDFNDICHENEDMEEETGALLEEVFGELDRQSPRNSGDSSDEEIFFVNCKDEETDNVSDKTLKDRVKSMETLKDNGATNDETVQSFKRAAKAVQDFDEKAIQKELERGAKDAKVHSIYVLMHLKELLEDNGFKQIGFQPGKDAGSVTLKNDKTETYIEMQFSREKGKEGAAVKITKNK